MYRVRQRCSTPITVQMGTVHYWPPDKYYSGWWPDPSFHANMERMIDLGGSRWNGSVAGRLAFKPCTHTKLVVTSFTPASPTYVQSLNSSNQPVGWAERWNGWATIQEVTQPPGKRETDPDPGDFVARYALNSGEVGYSEDTFASDWESCKPSMRTRANLAVFLYELQDFKRMFDFIPSKHLGLKSWKEALRTAKYANNQHLNYNFGWKPFINDIKKVINGVRSFDERLTKFINQSGQDMCRRRSHGNEDSSEWLIRPTEWTVYEDAKCTINYETVQSSTFQFRYDVPDYGQEDLRWRAFADTLGLHFDPANAWTVIPWSFVIDWFADVGSLLQSRSEDWTSPYITCIQACHCFKTTYNVEMFVRYSHHYDPKFHEGVNPFYRVIALRAIHFKRVVGIPNMGIATPSLNADRIRLLSSLLAGRIL